MAQSRDNQFSPSSPHSSSGGADSFKGTPDTRLTAFSPTDGSAKSARFMQDICRSTSTTPPARHTGRSYLDPTSPIDKDPFVSPSNRTGLSPTASSFQPFGQPSFVPSSAPVGVVASALSNDLGVSRLVAISALTAISLTQVEAWLKELDDKGVHFHGTRSIKPDVDIVYIQFDDIRDACSVHASSRLSTRDWKLDFAHPKSLQKGNLAQPDADTNEFGQIYIIARPQRRPHAEVFQTIEAVRNSLHAYGQLFAFVVLSTCQDGSFRAVAEFCNADAAVTVAASRRNCPILNEIHIDVALHNPDPASPACELGRTFQAMTFRSRESDPHQRRHSSSITSPRPATADRSQFSPALGMYPLMLQAPFGPNMPFLIDRFPNVVQTNPIMAPMSSPYPAIGSLYRTPPSPALTVNNQSPSRPLPGYGRPDARRQNATRINRSPHHNAASHHNHVDIHRIREGIDVRTTIMLRNIPNKVDQAMLKRIVDESSWGKYDFMYLRIDFANDCNVGYAFINFVDPLDIIDFVDARGNQRWNCFKSDKVAEISYATIQGKDCLVQKFRNSSVMLEAPHYRPKLYFTSNGPMPELAGQEEPFPEPDNQSKMKRSCENAEHVGLFTPNAGQHFRDEQRRRRSQYDRGTRLAALEEYDYEAAIQHHMYDAETH